MTWPYTKYRWLSARKMDSSYVFLALIHEYSGQGSLNPLSSVPNPTTARSISSPTHPFIAPINAGWKLIPGSLLYLISPYCRIYASMNRDSIGSGNGLVPNRGQAITWTNADLLSIGPLGTNFSEIQQIEILSFSFKKMQLKLSSA